MSSIFSVQTELNSPLKPGDALASSDSRTSLSLPRVSHSGEMSLSHALETSQRLHHAGREALAPTNLSFLNTQSPTGRTATSMDTDPFKQGLNQVTTKGPFKQSNAA